MLLVLVGGICRQIPVRSRSSAAKATRPSLVLLPAAHSDHLPRRTLTLMTTVDFGSAPAHRPHLFESFKVELLGGAVRRRTPALPPLILFTDPSVA